VGVGCHFSGGNKLWRPGAPPPLTRTPTATRTPPEPKNHDPMDRWPNYGGGGSIVGWWACVWWSPHRKRFVRQIQIPVQSPGDEIWGFGVV
jgi:hypothetical protein